MIHSFVPIAPTGRIHPPNAQSLEVQWGSSPIPEFAGSMG